MPPHVCAYYVKTHPTDLQNTFVSTVEYLLIWVWHWPLPPHCRDRRNTGVERLAESGEDVGFQTTVWLVATNTQGTRGTLAFQQLIHNFTIHLYNLFFIYWATKLISIHSCISTGHMVNKKIFVIPAATYSFWLTATDFFICTILQRGQFIPWVLFH